MNKKQFASSGFITIEFLTCILILMILSIKGFDSASQLKKDMKESTLRYQLGSIRSAVNVAYSKQLLDPTIASPQLPTLNDDLFQKGGIPEDPYFKSKVIILVDTNPISQDDLTNSGGWLYNPETGEVKANNERFFNL